MRALAVVVDASDKPLLPAGASGRRQDYVGAAGGDGDDDVGTTLYPAANASATGIWRGLSDRL